MDVPRNFHKVHVSSMRYVAWNTHETVDGSFMELFHGLSMDLPQVPTV